MNYGSFLKSRISLNTISIFEKNAPVAGCQNISRNNGFKFLNQTEFEALNFCFCEPEPDKSKYF